MVVTVLSLDQSWTAITCWARVLTCRVKGRAAVVSGDVELVACLSYGIATRAPA